MLSFHILSNPKILDFMDSNKKGMTNEKNFLKNRKSWTQYDFKNNSIISKLSQNMESFFQSLEAKKKMDNIYLFSTKFLKVSSSVILLY